MLARPRPSRLSAFAVAVAFATTSLIGLALESSTLAPAVAMSCPGGSFCLFLTAAPYGNGTGELYTTTDAGSTTKDGAIDCERAGGSTFGTCSHAYVIKGGHSLTVHVRFEAAAGSEVCVGAPPLGDTCGGSSDSADYTFSSGGDATLGDHGFRLLHPVTVSVSRAGTGSGTVTSDPIGIDCGSRCSAQFASGSQVRLTATAESGSTFSQWTGACSGSGAVCLLTPTRNRATTAVFDLIAAPSPGPTSTPGSTPRPTATISPPSGPTPNPAPGGSPVPVASGSLLPSESPTASASPSEAPTEASPATFASPSTAPAAASAAPALDPGAASADVLRVIGIGAVLTAIVLSVVIALFAIEDHRRRERRRRPPRSD